MKNIPTSSVHCGQYVMVLRNNYLYIGQATHKNQAADLSISVNWTNKPALETGHITHANFYLQDKNFQIFYKSSFPLDYVDLVDILQNDPELLL